MKILLFHPPTGLFLRQDRCQTPIENKSEMEPPNELGYIAAMVEPLGAECRIRDYPMVDATRRDFLNDLRGFRPDMIILGVTAATFNDDISYCDDAKKMDRGITTIVKAPYLTHLEAIKTIKNFKAIDIILLKEYEYTIKEIVECLKEGRVLAGIMGAIIRKGDEIIYADERGYIKNLDDLPFPARHLFNNKLYIRPDTGQPQATIQTARGCPFECIFCLASHLEGKVSRCRSPKNIVAEIKECVSKYNIRNFFFRADTFTLNKNWLIELCKLICAEGLEISWVCNSRVDTIDDERLAWMKKAGCWLISLGIESGNQDILDRIKKGTTLDDSGKAVALCRKHKIKSYCFYILGVPWDSRKTINDTIEFAKDLNGDFFFFHIAVPFAGTQLDRLVREHNLMDAESLYKHSHFEPSLRTLHLTSKELKTLWKKANWTLYSSPKYIARALSNIRSPKEFMNYVVYGYGKIKYLLINR